MRRDFPGVAALLALGMVLMLVNTVTGSQPVQYCRHAVRPVKRKQQQEDTSRRRQSADSDRIVRTQGDCTDIDGDTCPDCCDGQCCEELVNSNVSLAWQQSSSSSSPPQLWIPLRFAVIMGNNTNPSPVEKEAVEFQIRVLNEAFKDTLVRFFLHSVEVFRDDKLRQSCDTDPCVTDEECEFLKHTMPQIRVNSEEVITTAVCDVSHFYGEAQLPWVTIENSPLQYLIVSMRIFGNAGVATDADRGHGKTMVHEIGHYFGLLHTFEKEGKCDAAGDYVADTPRASIAADVAQACDTTMDTCSQFPGVDSFKNYMNYAKDECMTDFTPGQVSRMYQAITKFRPKLLQNSLAQGNCPVETTYELGDCSCADSSKSPLTYCGTKASTYDTPGFVEDLGTTTVASATTAATTTTTTMVSDSTALAVALSTDSPSTAAPPLNQQQQQTPNDDGSSSTPQPTPQPTTAPGSRQDAVEQPALSNTVIVILAVAGSFLLLGIVIGVSIYCAKRQMEAKKRRLEKYMQPKPGRGPRVEEGGDGGSDEELEEVDEAELELDQLDDHYRRTVPLPGYGTRPGQGGRGGGFSGAVMQQPPQRGGRGRGGMNPQQQQQQVMAARGRGGRGAGGGNGQQVGMQMSGARAHRSDELYSDDDEDQDPRREYAGRRQ